MPSRNMHAVAPQSFRRAADEKPKPGEPPLCPRCGTRMKWFNTDLKRDEYSRLVHTFFCEACSEVVHVDEPWRGNLRSVP